MAPAAKDLTIRTAQTLTQYQLLAPKARVLAAVSGGADSVCLLYLLHHLRKQFGFYLCVGHVNHRLRPEAGEDAQFVEALAAKLKLPFARTAVNAKALARRKKLSLEDAARQARYAALGKMAKQFDAYYIALGHTADDQVETIILNLLRGGGPEGMAGMPITRPLGQIKIIRPLLAISKAETEQYCRDHKLNFRLDASNLDTSILRNRLRHKILTVLRAEQPALDKVLLRQAEIFRAEDEYLRSLTESALAEVTLGKTTKEIALAIEKLTALPEALARRVVREALRGLRPGRQPLGLEQVERVLALAKTGKTGKGLELGEGLWAEKSYGELRLERRRAGGKLLPNESPFDLALGKMPPPRSFAKTLNAERSTLNVSLPIPGEVRVGRQIIGAKLIKREMVKDLTDAAGGKIALLDAAHFAPGEKLAVRFPRPGDRFRPLGGGTIKLQDFFVNLKIPRAERERVPLVCLGEKIIWVAGYRIAEDFKVKSATRRILRLALADAGRDRNPLAVSIR
jgi:tRNA(Ile)-lysidine synthase